MRTAGYMIYGAMAATLLLTSPQLDYQPSRFMAAMLGFAALVGGIATVWAEYAEGGGK